MYCCFSLFKSISESYDPPIILFQKHTGRHCMQYIIHIHASANKHTQSHKVYSVQAHRNMPKSNENHKHPVPYTFSQQHYPHVITSTSRTQLTTFNCFHIKHLVDSASPCSNSMFGTHQKLAEEEHWSSSYLITILHNHYKKSPTSLTFL